MDWVNSALAGVVAGGALTYGSTVLTRRSTAQRDGRKAEAEARAKRREEWAAFQIQTIADLQEQLDAISPVLGAGTNGRELEGVLKAMFSAGGMPAHQVAYFRAMMLCSRLEDMDLAAQIRGWLTETRAAIAGTLGGEFGRLRDERLALQDDLGAGAEEISRHLRGSQPVTTLAGRQQTFPAS